MTTKTPGLSGVAYQRIGRNPPAYLKCEFLKKPHFRYAGVQSLQSISDWHLQGKCSPNSLAANGLAFSTNNPSTCIHAYVFFVDAHEFLCVFSESKVYEY